jgi:hypothetical protein
MVSKQILSRELRSLGYQKLSARPRHHERDEAAVAAFKKPARFDAACGDRNDLRYPGYGRERPSTFWWRVTP